MTHTLHLRLLMHRAIQLFFLGTLITLAALPMSADAATTRPTCELTIVIGDNEVTLEEGKVILPKGEEMTITWESKKAKTATNDEGDKISLSGTATASPARTTEYSFTFASGSRKAECSVTAVVVEGAFTTSTLHSRSQKPVISGTATGTKSVELVMYKKDGESVLYRSKTIKVSKGKWKTSVTKKLPWGTYDVELLGVKSLDLRTITEGTLVVGTSTNTSTKVDTTLSVAYIPLLGGGVVRAGASVPVSYLQIENTGKSTTTLAGFTVMQNGSAPASTIIGLTTVDDKGGSRGSVGGMEGASPFKDGKVFVPVTNVTFAPGQMRLFTIKAILSTNVSAHLGKQLKLDVTGLTAGAGVKGTFPIRGTTWTITP